MDGCCYGDNNDEHPQVIAIILSVLEHDVAEVLEFIPDAKRSDIIKLQA